MNMTDLLAQLQGGLLSQPNYTGLLGQMGQQPSTQFPAYQPYTPPPQQAPQIPQNLMAMPNMGASMTPSSMGSLNAIAGMGNWGNSSPVQNMDGGYYVDPSFWNQYLMMMGSGG